VAAGQRPDSLPSLSRLATAFTATMRSHLAWEERVILPLARRRLSTAQAEAIGRRMAARRGVAYPER
jgi:hemerythrin-like domain-containing protein